MEHFDYFHYDFPIRDIIVFIKHFLIEIIIHLLQYFLDIPLFFEDFHEDTKQALIKLIIFFFE
jgi:hypothetical protein